MRACLRAFLIVVLCCPMAARAEGKEGGKNLFDPDQIHNFARRETLAGGLEASASIVTYHKFGTAVETVFNWAFGDLRRVALLLDPSTIGSDIARINAEAAGKPVSVEKETIQILGLARKVHGMTHGAFDIVHEAGATAAGLKINKAARTVQFAKPGMRIRLDHLVEGYLTDLLFMNLWNANIDNALVQVGGAARSVGRDMVGPWHLSIADLTGKYAARGISLSFSNLSAATVGAGKRAPTTDFRTKQDLTPPCRGATILARDAATSLAIANAVYILGPTEGLKLAHKLSTRAVFMGHDGTLTKSPGL